MVFSIFCSPWDEKSGGCVMPTVFISYRRSESSSEAGRLFDYLEQELGPENVFKDVDSISGGADFREAINDFLARAELVLVLIGRDWANIQDETGARRLDSPKDFVRMEVSAALAAGSRVIPLLLNDADMPSSSELPEELQALTYRNALKLRPDPDFRVDVRRLMAEMTGQRRATPGGVWRTAWLRISAIAVAAVVVSQLLDVPNKLLDTYSKAKEVFGNNESPASQLAPADLSGAVFDATSRPLEGVEILLTEYGQRILTDANGRYSLQLESPRSNLVGLRAVKQGFQPRNLDAPLGDPSFKFVMKRQESE
jgi:hypothetical protein